MVGKRGVLPQASYPWVDSQGVPTEAFRSFMLAVRDNNIGPLPAALDDVAAAKAGVPVNGLYQNAGSVKIRLI